MSINWTTASLQQIQYLVRERNRLTKDVEALQLALELTTLRLSVCKKQSEVQTSKAYSDGYTQGVKDAANTIRKLEAQCYGKKTQEPGTLFSARA